MAPFFSGLFRFRTNTTSCPPRPKTGGISRACLTVLALLCFLLISSVPSAFAAKDVKRVLILHSYHWGFLWTDNVMAGMDEVFARAGEQGLTLEILVEYMDSKRIAPDLLAPFLVQLLQLKYSSSPPDVILSSDDNAFNFLLAHGDELFPGIPIVFCGVNNFTDQMIAGHDNITGVMEDFDLTATVDLALSLHPLATSLALITDSTPTGFLNHQRFMDHDPPFSEQAEIIDLADLTATELTNKLHELPRHTVILNLSFFRDRDGRAFSTLEGNQLIARESGLPVYSCWDFYLGSGIVGGKLVSGKSQGREAALKAVAILRGEPVHDIPILRQSPNQYMFDYGPLLAAGLSIEDVPEGSLIINQPKTLYHRYKKEMWIVSAGFVLLTLLLAFMVFILLQRKRAEQQLATTLAEFQSIFDNSQTGILMLRGGREVYRANQRLADIFGYDSPDELVGQNVRMFHRSQETYEQFGEKYFDTLIHQQNVHIEYEAQRKDGSPIWILISGKAVDTGQPPDLDKGVIWVMDDITKRKQFEKELAALNRQLEDRVRERTAELETQTKELTEANLRLLELDNLKSSFLSTVSHDLRTPLTSIRGFAKLIHRDLAKVLAACKGAAPEVEKRSERVITNLCIIENEGDRLTRLINDVLDLTRIETGRQTWRDQELAVDKVVDGALDSMKGDFMSKPQVRLDVSVSPDLPGIYADPDRVHQVLVNLLSNAIKFTETGEIRVRVGMSEGNMILTRVSDTGCGVPNNELGMVFDKFHQVTRGDTLVSSSKGSGLGLAICKEIVSHYGGTIWGESEEGEGSTFYFTLPAMKGGEAGAA